MRRHDLSEEEARKRIPDTVARALDLPFVTLRSQSTGQHFRLFIRHGPLQVTAEEGGFTCYGLSKGGFVPRDLSFSLDDSTGRVVVKVTDSTSGEVIRQIPSEEALRLAERLDEARSLLFKAEA